MTEAKEAQQVNEELSSEELKNVSGGVWSDGNTVNTAGFTPTTNLPDGDHLAKSLDPQCSVSGMTLRDYYKRVNVNPNFGPDSISRT